MQAKLMILVLILTTVALTTVALAQDPIAHYPLESDAVDVTGNQGDMDLEDTPFMDGGIYCNGDFWGFTCVTPFLSNFNRETFTFTVEFKVENYHSVNMPVMWLGYGWRTFGFEISPEGYAGLTTNSGDAYFVPSDVIVTFGEWHTARVSWNADMGFASAYLDGDLITLAEREPINPSADMRLLPKNGSYGRGFEGIIKNLKVYDTDDPGVVAIEGKSFSNVKNMFK